MKRCPASYCPHLIPNNARYCPEHLAVYEAHRGTPAQRGYGASHRATRAAYAQRLSAGEAVFCGKCGDRIDPSQPWDLGHTEDRQAWTGPEHLNCNRSEAGRRGAQLRNAPPD